MALTAAFTVSQGIDDTKATIIDTTDYTSEPKSGLTNRVLTFYTADGALYRTVQFSYSTFTTDQVDITGLEKDYALTITMTITPASAVNGSTYVASSTAALVAGTNNAYNERMKKISENPHYERNSDYVEDCFKLLMFQETATRVAALGDIAGAQILLDKARRITQFNKIPY